MHILKAFRLALAGLFFATAAVAQSSTVTNHAFAIGKGPGTTGYTSLLCGSAQLAVGQTSADPICRTITGDVTINAAGATAIGSGKVLGSMLGAMTSAELRGALSDETGTGIAYFVGGALGTPASGTLTNATGLPFAGLADNTMGALTHKVSPTTSDLLVLQDQAAGGANKYASVAEVIGAIGTGVTSFGSGSRTGAVTGQADDYASLAGQGARWNIGLSASVAGSALTIALKDAGGSNPSSTSPVVMNFRHATASTGTPQTRSVTAATSLVISSGSTMGTTNNVPFRLWIVAFDDGGTIRLGAINCATSTQIIPLAEGAFKSSTAEGGAGAADSAGVIYTGTAASSKAVIVLGYMTWNSGLGTAGTWSAGPDVIQLFGQGIPLPGQPTGNTVFASVQTVTNLVGAGDSSYTATVVTTSITPTAAPNRIVVSWRGGFVTNGAAKWAKLVTTRGGANIGLVTNVIFATSSTIISAPGAGDLMDAPGSAGSVTYGVSIACDVGTACTFPYNGSGSDTGGTMVLTEIQG